MLELLQAGDVFAEDVELEIDDSAHADVLEIGVLHGVGDDGHLEGMGGGTADGERHAVDSDRAFVYGEIALQGHLAVLRIGESEIGGAVGIIYSSADSRLVDMALHDVAVQAAVHKHGPFHIDLVAHLKQAEVRAVEGFLHGCDHIAVAIDGYHREAHAVVGHALVNLQLAGE